MPALRRADQAVDGRLDAAAPRKTAATATIDADRLWRVIPGPAAFGTCIDVGAAGLALSPDDRRLRDWFRRRARALGRSVGFDAVGNVSACRPKSRDGLLPIAIGMDPPGDGGGS